MQQLSCEINIITKLTYQQVESLLNPSDFVKVRTHKKR